MRIAFDTNVVVDVLLQRKPFWADAAALFAYVREERVEGILGATTVTTSFFLTRRATTREQAQESIGRLLGLFSVAPVDAEVLQAARASGVDDYEDAVLSEAARRVRADGLVTRNEQDFEAADLAVYRPEELLSVIEARDAG